MESLMETDLSRAEALVLLAKAQFRPFRNEDWYAFGNCETKKPLIAEEVSFGESDSDIYIGEDLYTIVIDGDTILFVRESDKFGGQQFKLKEI